MTKEDFLTVRWNNVLMLGLGLLVVVFAAVALVTPLMSDLAGFIGTGIIGVLY